MKKAVLILGAFFIFAGLSAQYGYEAGVKAGVNLSTQFTSAADTDVETDWNPGFQTGIFGRLLYTEIMAAQLEFLYTLKGSHWNDPEYSGKEVLTYVDVPLTARFQAHDLLNLHAGPQFSFLTGARRIPDDGVAYSVSEYYDEVDLGLVLGAELTLPINLNLTLRYIEGLIVTSDSRYYPDPWKNRVFQLSVSYAIWGE